MFKLNHDRSPGLYKGDDSLIHFAITGDYMRFAQKVANKINFFMATKVNPARTPEFVERYPRYKDSIFSDLIPESVPVIKYEEFMKRVRKAVTTYTGLDITWEKRYRAIVSLVNYPDASQKGNHDYIYDLAYGLCWKMVLAGENDLAIALDLDIENSRVWDKLF